MISMVLGLVLGAYGLLGKHLKMFVWASICSLTAGKHGLLAQAFNHAQFTSLNNNSWTCGLLKQLLVI
jgi:hypothetical protein